MKSLGKSGLKVDRRKRTNGAAPNLVLADARQSRAEKECDKKRALDIFADGNSTFRNEEGKREMET